MRIGSLCTGYGGLDMATQSVLDGDLAFVADPDPGAVKILAHHHPRVPNLGDINAVDWSGVEPVDVLTAGFPCQDISNAGYRAGIGGGRSGVWANVVAAVGALRPRIVFFENVGALTVRGLDTVLGDLAEIGFDAEWASVRASDSGAPHRRERIFILGWPSSDPPSFGWREGRPESAGLVGRPDVAIGGGQDWGAYAAAIRRWERVAGRTAPVPTEPGRAGSPRLSPRFTEWLMGLPAGYVTGPELGLSRVQQLHALGNGVVPQQGECALRLLLDRTVATEAA